MKIHWVGCFPAHQSVGDHAQILAVQYFLKEYFADYEVAQYTLDEIDNFFHACIKPEDLILIHSGGGFGDLYPTWHETRKQIIAKFPHNRIIQLPVSVLYKSPAQFEEDKIFFADKHNLTILCRHEKDAALLSANFGCHVEHFPDFVYYLKPHKARHDREGVLFVLRNDAESTLETKLTSAAKKLQRPLTRVGRAISKDLYFIALNLARKISRSPLESAIKTRFPTAAIKDVQVASAPITDANRERVVFNALDYYTRFKLVVTDRFHALVFAALTRTPAIALPTLISQKTTAPNRTYPREQFETFRKRFIEDFKPTSTTNQEATTNVLDIIKQRRSIRKWLNKPVESWKINVLLEAGVYAPTASNSQAIGFQAVTDTSVIAQLCHCTSEWFQNSPPAAVIVVYYDVSRGQTCGIDFNGWQRRFIWQDGAAAMMSMMLAAESVGLKTCWATTYPPNAAAIKKILHLRDTQTVTSMLFFGYSNQKASLDATHQGRPIRRRVLAHQDLRKQCCVSC